MLKTVQYSSAIVFLLVAAPSLPAQAGPADSATVQAAAATLRSDLRNLVTAQEAYFADHVTYARSLREISGYQPSRGVTVVLLTSSDSGHSEIAIVDRVPGLVCALFVGQAPRPFGTGKEGLPACRGP
jgi:hypothetical protein